jgi:hypothetical protein
MSDPDRQSDAYFESLGEPEVRYLAEQLWSGQQRGAAFRWLGKQRQHERALTEASSSEQIRLARESNAVALDAKTIAQHAKTVAIATLIVAIIGSAAAIAGLFMH